MRKAASRTRTRVGRYVSVLPRKEPPSVCLYLYTALKERLVCNESGDESRLCRPFLAIGGVRLRLDTHQGMRSAREQTNPCSGQTGRTGPMSPKLTPDERRAVVMAALDPDVNISEIARRYGIRRQRIYQLLESAMIDPKEKLREAEREVAFRRRVKELVG